MMSGLSPRCRSEDGGRKKLFTGGSGVLTEGLIKDTQMLRLAGFFILTAIIGIYLTYACGWPVLALGLSA